MNNHDKKIANESYLMAYLPIYHSLGLFMHGTQKAGAYSIRSYFLLSAGDCESRPYYHLFTTLSPFNATTSTNRTVDIRTDCIRTGICNSVRFRYYRRIGSIWRNMIGLIANLNYLHDNSG